MMAAISIMVLAVQLPMYFEQIFSAASDAVLILPPWQTLPLLLSLGATLLSALPPDHPVDHVLL
jgi:hypothetical protein